MAGTTEHGRRWAYIGSFTEAGGPGLTVAEADDATGALKPMHTTDAVVNPSYLALSPGGDVLYAVSETDEGAAAAFSLADPARPELLGAPVAVRGDGPTHLAVAGPWLFTANYGSGSVSALPVRVGGSLGAPSAVLPHRGRGPVADRQASPHAHAVVPDPSGRWLLAVDLGTDSVGIHALDPVTGAPSPHGETPLRPGTGPRHLVFHPDGHRVYVLGELEPTVTVCRWDASAGTLEPVSQTRVLPPGAVSPSYPSAPVVSADGRFLWAANRGDDTIATLALDAAGDGLELRATTDCGGHWPRDLTAHPDGRLLYAANERSGDVTWFTVDPDTGIPVRAGSLALPAASCVLFA
ncbi:lactonase family protein [Streptomyces triculaminicus]|uniref:Lactonase family protein n=1 Tax=Streptomyces triculaminicus TaxID=2816232 RepID=A0A939JR15_9ACTN|nr:lactonase family protein [Streptomyces triculaminicus]MBO0656158.1 lactonase family protein [Streptomyces triculaminicus]